MPPKSDAQKKVEDIIASYKMIEGDYTVQIRILEGNDFIPTIGGFFPFQNKGSSCDAMVEVEINGQKKRTKVKKGQISPVFNEMFYFRLHNQKKQQLKDHTIKITAFDKRTFALKNPIIGSYTLDLCSVYFSLNHELYRTWLALSDPTDEREGVLGYVLVNVTVLGPNDEPVVHTVSSQKSPDAPNEQSLVPKKIKQFSHTINVKLYKGEHMVPLDMISSDIDAYVQLKYAGINVRSKIVKSRNPEWNQELNLGCMLPNQSKFINFEIFDRDFLAKDDMVGCFKLIFKDVYNKTDTSPRWANIYGPPIYGKGQYADLMTLYGDSYGSHYRGRILFQIATYDERHFKNMLQPRDIKFKFPDNPQPNSEQKSYILRVDLIEGHEFPQRSKCFIHVLMGPYLLCSKEYLYEKGTVYFYEQLPDKKVLFPKNVEEIPDIIFYIADEHIQDRRMCFYRIKASEVIDQPVKQPRVLKMKEDRSLQLVKDDEFPGFLYVNVQLMSANPGPRKTFLPDVNSKIDYELRVFLFVGRDIPPADTTGTSDPYVKIRCGGDLKQSKVRYQTLNPSWYETLILDIKMFPLEQPCVVPGGMLVMIFDKNEDDESDHLIGRTWITLEPNLIQFQKDKESPIIDVYYRKPKWFNIIYDPTEEIQGKILLSYVLIKKDQAHLVPVDDSIYPRHQKTKLHFFCIGVRNIAEQVGDIQPSNCSLSFNVNGNPNQIEQSVQQNKGLSSRMSVKGSQILSKVDNVSVVKPIEDNDEDISPILTDPMKIKASGININRVINLTIDVPNNANFCPVLEVQFWEEPLDKKPKQLMGITSIELSQILSSYYEKKKRVAQPIKMEVINEDSSEEDEKELLDRINHEFDPKDKKTDHPQKNMGGQLEIIKEEDLDNIDLKVPRELPVKRKLLEHQDYQRKIIDIENEQKELENILVEEEVRLNVISPEDDIPQVGQTTFMGHYPKNWIEYKQQQNQPQSDSLIISQNDKLIPPQYPSLWNQFKLISPAKIIEYEQEDVDLSNDQYQSLHQILGKDSFQNYSDLDELSRNQEQRRQSYEDQEQFQPQPKNQSIPNSELPSIDQSKPKNLSSDMAKEKNQFNQQISYQSKQSQNPLIKQQTNNKIKPQGIGSYQDQQSQQGLQKMASEFSARPLEFKDLSEMSISVYKNVQAQRPPPIDDDDDEKVLDENPVPKKYVHISPKLSSRNDFADDNQFESNLNVPNEVQSQQKRQSLNFQSKLSIKQNTYQEPSVAQQVERGSIRQQASQRQIIEVEQEEQVIVPINNSLQSEGDCKPLLQQKSRGSISKVQEKNTSNEAQPRRASQVKQDLRSQGSRYQILDELHKDVPPDEHYKDKQRKSIEPQQPFPALSVKESVKSGKSVKSERFGSQIHVPYSQQITQIYQESPNQILGEKVKIWRNFEVDSKVSFSAASKVSSHALSIASVGQDNMNAKPSENPHVRKPLKKKFSDRIRGGLDIFGFNFKKVTQKEVDIETYEDYDTDPEEDLSIIPPWLRDRPFFNDDLEDYVKPSRKFMEFNIKRGKLRGSKNIFHTEKETDSEVVCKLKCIFLESKEDGDIEKKKELYTKLMKPKSYHCRLYILEGVNLNTDGDDPPDTYLKIKVPGKPLQDFQKETLRLNSINPQYYFAFEDIVEIPGSSFIRIEVYQKTTFESHLVGVTEIDLEDRYFSIMWHRYDLKPLENRVLKNEDGGSVGRLQMWIDLIEKQSAKSHPLIKIEPPPRYKFELRTIVWETKDCVFKDELEKCNDLFARGGPSSLDFQETDTHWRCRAKGSFNWRMKYAINYPMLPEEYGSDQFKIQLWDKDVVGSNELIGEYTMALNTHKMIDKAVKRRKTVKMLQRIREKGGQITDKFWLQVFHPDALDAEGKQIVQGQVLVSFELLPWEEVEKAPNGLGRDAPNNFPPLPEPSGRLSFDIANPLKFVQDIMGPTLYQKLCATLFGCIFFILLVGFGYLLIPMIISGYITK